MSNERSIRDAINDLEKSIYGLELQLKAHRMELCDLLAAEDKQKLLTAYRNGITITHQNIVRYPGGAYLGDTADLQWSPSRVTYAPDWGYKAFSVLIAHRDQDYFVKPDPHVENEHARTCQDGPQVGVHCAEYEHFFGFGNHCRNYDPENVVKISMI